MLVNFDGIYFKVNQVIYLSSHISELSFKLLAEILFEISCQQYLFQTFSKGLDSKTGDTSDKRIILLSYFTINNPYLKFQCSSFHGLKVILCA